MSGRSRRAAITVRRRERPEYHSWKVVDLAGVFEVIRNGRSARECESCRMGRSRQADDGGRHHVGQLAETDVQRVGMVPCGSPRKSYVRSVRRAADAAGSRMKTCGTVPNESGKHRPRPAVQKQCERMSGVRVESSPSTSGRRSLSLDRPNVSAPGVLSRLPPFSKDAPSVGQHGDRVRAAASAAEVAGAPRRTGTICLAADVDVTLERYKIVFVRDPRNQSQRNRMPVSARAFESLDP